MAMKHPKMGNVSVKDLVSLCEQLELRGQSAEAATTYLEWISENKTSPSVFLVYYNYACQLKKIGRNEEAIHALQEAIAINQDFLHAHINLSSLLSASGQTDSALHHLEKVRNILSNVNAEKLHLKKTALRNTAKLLLDMRQLEKAEQILYELIELDTCGREAIEHYVGVRQKQCLFPVIHGVERPKLLRNMQPLSLLYLSDDPWMQLGLSADYARSKVGNERNDDDLDRRNRTVNLEGRRLRVGYVSSDLNDHALGSLIVELFELHDRARIELFAYYSGTKVGVRTYERFRHSAEHWTDIASLTDRQAAKKIADDEIDILIDLNGHTAGARLGIFLHHPSPIVINWLGYPGTLGTPYHDYIIADDWIIPEGSECYYSEKVLRLPCYQPNDRKRQVARLPTRAEAGLPEKGFVFCCFSTSQKLTQFTIDRWATILGKAEDSLLWLLDDGSEMKRNISAFMESKGVSARRLVFAPKVSHANHLARYPLADLFLDSCPYGAHTTGSDALWMGVPVLTLSGRGFASRVCGSLVRAAGLPDMVVETPEAYTQRAVSLALNPSELANIRTRLVKGRDQCTLFDVPQLTRSLEDLFSQLASSHSISTIPQPNLTNLSRYLTAGCEFDHENEEMLARTDYNKLYVEKLARQHKITPLPEDRRLWHYFACQNT